MRILITGGCGFIGSNLAIFLKEKIKNVKITSIDNLSRKGLKSNKMRGAGRVSYTIDLSCLILNIPI